MNTQNVNIKTATPESPKTWAEGKKSGISMDQFNDVYEFMRTNAVFVGISGINGALLTGLEAIEEPTDEPEAATIYLHEGWPLALYIYDVGYLIFRNALISL